MTTDPLLICAKVLWKAYFGRQLPQSKVAARVPLNVLCWCSLHQKRANTENKRNRNGGRDDVLLKCNIGH